MLFLALAYFRLEYLQSDTILHLYLQFSFIPKFFSHFSICYLGAFAQLQGIGPDMSELEYGLSGVEPVSGTKYFSVNATGKIAYFTIHWS